MIVGAVGLPGVAGGCITMGLAEGRTGGCVFTLGGAGLVNGSYKTAPTPGDGYAQETGVYLGPYIMSHTPQT